MHDLYPIDIATLDRATLEQIVQQRVQSIYLGDGVVMVRALTRYKMFLHTADRGFACHVMMDGYWEIWVTQFFARMIKPGMQVIDVGANYGYYTLLFADTVTSTGRVLAVEPNILRQSIQLNGFTSHTQVLEVGLGATTTETTQLFVPMGEPKNAHITSIPGGPGRVHIVPMTTLDKLASDLDHVDIIKIDAEGSEEEIIYGMQRILQRDHPGMVLEFNSKRCVAPAALLDHLLSFYGAVSVIGYDGVPISIDSDTLLTKKTGEDWMLYFGPTGLGD
jgi:FkbM family methyltransferase